MRPLITVLFIIVVLWSNQSSADNLYVEGGAGIWESHQSSIFVLRYQWETSTLFRQPSYWEAIALCWDRSRHSAGAAAAGIARSIDWNRKKRDSYASAAFGLVGVNHTTDHLGTRFQFYSRVSFVTKIRDHKFAIGIMHISNGKAVFGWNGPNSGENYLTVSMSLF